MGEGALTADVGWAFALGRVGRHGEEAAQPWHTCRERSATGRAPRGHNPWRTRMVSSFMRLPAIGLVAGIVVGVVLAFTLSTRRGESDELFAPRFPAAGLVTNEFA